MITTSRPAKRVLQDLVEQYIEAVEHLSLQAGSVD